MTTLDSTPQLTVDFDVEGRQVGSFDVPLPTAAAPHRQHHSPLMVLRQGEGPIVCLLSGVQSGDATGTTILQSLLQSIELEHIKGTLIVCPAFVPTLSSEYSADQLEFIKQNFADDVLESVDVLIEIGSGAETIECTAHASVWPGDDEEKNAIAEAVMMASGAPDSVRRFDPAHTDSFAWVAQLADTPYVRFDLGRYAGGDKSHRLMGMSCVRNALLHIGVLSEGHFDLSSTRILEVAKPATRIHAPVAGLVHWHVDLGGAVHMGNPIAEIHDPHRPFADPVIIDARMNGVLLSKIDSALTSPDQLLAIVGDEVSR